MKPHDPNIPVDKTVLPKLFREILIHQDIIAYVKGLRQKVLTVISEGVLVVSSAYKDFANFGVNQGALAELQSNSLMYDFEYFTKS